MVYAESCRVMSKWTATNVSDLTGHYVIVTGANSGLGFQTALELARHGSRVVLACRDQQKGVDALQRIHEVAPSTSIEIAELNLTDLTSIRRFAHDWAARLDYLS